MKEEPPSINAATEFFFAIERDTSNTQLAQLRQKSYDLYIVAQAKDDYGVINPLHFCFDKLLSNGNEEVLVSEIKYHGGEPGANPLVCDYYPWGAEYAESNCGSGNSCPDCEIDCGWPDPFHAPGGIGGHYHMDWCGEESTIMWWPLSDALAVPSGYDGYEVVGVKVRVADSQRDPFGGYSGNWRRSGELLDQLCYRSGQRRASSSTGSCQSYYATVRFVADNPRDFQAEWFKWKIYNYSGDTTDYETSMISRRGANGLTELHLIIMAETDDKIIAETQEEIDEYFPETIEVQFKSNEVLPEGTSIAKTVNGLVVRYDLCAGENSLPIGLNYEKMSDLLYKICPPDSMCIYTFYYLKLKVTDNQITDLGEPGMNIPPVLYVSSRDHLLGMEGQASIVNMLDYAESIAVDGERDARKQLDHYGKIRGMGFKPSGKEQWYGYEEYLINGGFVTVEVSEIESGFNIVGQLPYVPVQSEADVMMIHGHGSVDESNNKREIAGIEYYICDDYRPKYNNVSDSWNANMQLFLGTELMGSFSDYMRSPDETYTSGEFNKYPDFDSSPYSWGNFWGKGRQEQDKEMRWLVLVSCTNLSELEPERPDKNWQKVIQEGYVQSVCGFSDSIIPGDDFLYGNPNMLSKYAEYLQDLVMAELEYEPGEERFIFEEYWADGSKTTDNSIAAWMEAAYRAIIISEVPETLINTNKVHSASAVDANCKWYLEGALEFAESGNPEYMVIKKKSL